MDLTLAQEDHVLLVLANSVVEVQESLFLLFAIRCLFVINDHARLDIFDNLSCLKLTPLGRLDSCLEGAID